MSQSSELVEPLWTDPGLKNGISVHELMVSTFKNNFLKKAQAGNGLSHILIQILTHEGEKASIGMSVCKSDLCIATYIDFCLV